MVIFENISTTTNTVITVLSRRKARHVIHGDGFPRLNRGRQQIIEALLLNGWFGNGACSVGSDVILNVLSKVQPIEIILQYYHYFLDPKMPSDLTEVRFPNHLGMLA